MSTVVDVTELSFAYQTQPILSDVSFSIQRGESVCIVGPNGGGKTTLLKLLLGMLEPDSGSISILGGQPARMRSRIGYMPQHLSYDQAFPANVIDIVIMGRMRPLGFYSKEDRKIAMNALDELGIAELHKRPFASLSGGQRQRVLIARALASRPELLLLDEPTANVDPASESQFYEILRDLAKRITILTVSHDLGFVSQVVDRVLCVNQQVKIHPTSEITGEIIQDIYGGDLKMIRHDHSCSAWGHHHE